MSLLPKSIEEYIPQDDPVRAYDVFVEALDFNKFGIEKNPHKVGNSEYDPKAMLKLFVYGYSYGTKSSRKLKREKINQTNPDCANMRSIHGKHASYNVQNVLDDKNVLVVHSEAVNNVTDLH